MFSNIKVYPLLAKDALSPRVAGYNCTNEFFLIVINKTRWMLIMSDR